MPDFPAVLSNSTSMHGHGGLVSECHGIYSMKSMFCMFQVLLESYLEQP